MEQLKATTDALAKLLAALEIDVFVPLYANTFPLATVAKRACREHLAKAVSIRHFAWGWDGAWSRSLVDPPFLSAKKYQLFFATEAEFRRIHAAGISFFCVPVTVFHPKFIFISQPRAGNGRPSSEAAHELKGLIEDTLEKKNIARCSTRYDLSWVSDIPNQAEALARHIDGSLGTCLAAEPARPVIFWQSRSIEQSLGVRTARAKKNKEPQAKPVKAFIWGGPLASAALHDVPGGSEGRRERLGWPRLRDRESPSDRIEIPGLLSVLGAEEIRREHSLYCCIGYKETRNLESYYCLKKHLKDVEPWSLKGEKIKSVGQPKIPLLVRALQDFFASLFLAAKQLERFGEAESTRAETLSLFEEFRHDYDKHCRTINPIAQIYTAEEYARCLHNHHDEEALRELHPQKSGKRHPV